MSEGWKEYTLNEVYDFSSGLSKPRKEFGFGNPFLAFKDVFNNYFLPSHLSNLVNTTDKECQSFSVAKGDVFLTRTSETQDELGISSVALINYPNATFNGFTKRLRPKGTIEVLPQFAGFYFRSPRFRAEVTTMASITTRASLNNDILSQLKIVVPPIKEQESIANILYSIHQKIDNLRRQNETLEAIAQNLFKHWFINFQFPNEDGKPYRSSGGEMVSSELGEIPKGWRVGKLGDFCTIFRGSSPRPISSPTFFENGYIPWIKIADATKANSIYLSETTEHCTEAALPYTRFLKKGSLILSNSATVGIPIILNLDGCIHDGWLSFKDYKLITRNFLFFVLSNKLKLLTQYADGTVQKNLNTGILNNMTFILPNAELIIKFTDFTETIFNKILNNERQLQTLTKTRDTLLPKLMSGQLRVKE